MTDTEKELLDCLKEYIKQTETAHVQEGIWFNKVYKDAKALVKKLTIPVFVGRNEQLTCQCCGGKKNDDGICMNGNCSVHPL